ncbi:MAG: pitrilysin family protein [Acidobacteriota bacterium]
MRRIIAIALLCYPPALAADPLADLEKRIAKHTLANGMRIVVYERHEIPTFTGVVGVRVGGVDDPKGGTGLAHLFEHMAFKGTPAIGTLDFQKELDLMKQQDVLVAQLQEAQRKRGVDPAQVDEYRKRLKDLEDQQRRYIVKDEFFRVYTTAGAPGLAAMTTNDITLYTASLPSNKLEMFFLMESERYKHPLLREFYTERDVVREERRMYDDTPRGKLEEELYSAAFRAHPYHQPVVGWMEDLDQLTREMAEEFRNEYYVPGNTVIALVGDVDTKTVIALAERYFGDVPAAPLPPPITTLEPEQRGERHVEVEWDAEPEFLMGFHVPTFPQRDAYVLTVISEILADGRSSRLYDKLVKQARVASSVSAEARPGIRYEHLIMFSATPIAPATTENVVAEIWKEIDRMKREPVTVEELQRRVNQAQARQIRVIESNRFAFSLLAFELMFNDWSGFLKWDDIVASVTPDEIMKVCRTYFQRQHCTVAEIVRPTRHTGEVSDEK